MKPSPCLYVGPLAHLRSHPGRNLAGSAAVR
jgi:hypothetical protein